MTVRVAIAQSEQENIDEIGRLLGQVCRELIPSRPDTYSWMIRIEQIYGKFIESYMGGWLGKEDLLSDGWTSWEVRRATIPRYPS
jgi:hypothetical protein